MKNTIAEKRLAEVHKLADNYTHDFSTAKNLMNRFYRVCGALERLLYLENDEKTCNRRYTLELSDKTDKAVKRLKADFNKCGLILEFYGYLPTITDHKGGNDVIYRYFYND